MCLTQLCRGLPLQDATGQEASTADEHEGPIEGPAEGDPRCPATTDQGPTTAGTTGETTCKHPDNSCIYAEETITGRHFQINV